MEPLSTFVDLKIYLNDHAYLYQPPQEKYVSEKDKKVGTSATNAQLRRLMKWEKIVSRTKQHRFLFTDWRNRSK